MSITKKSLSNAAPVAKPATKSTKTVAPVSSKAVTALRFNSALRVC